MCSTVGNGLSTPPDAAAGTQSRSLHQGTAEWIRFFLTLYKTNVIMIKVVCLKCNITCEDIYNWFNDSLNEFMTLTIKPISSKPLIKDIWFQRDSSSHWCCKCAWPSYLLVKEHNTTLNFRLLTITTTMQKK